MRAVEPRDSGTLQVSGFEIAWEEFGDPENPPVLLYPSWQIVHSRIWKMQVPFLSRFWNVITLDIPGNGRAERTTDPKAFEIDRIVDYGIGLLDHLQIDRADAVGLSMGASFALWAAARYPERIRSVVAVGAALPAFTCAEDPEYWIEKSEYRGWEKRNVHYWREDYNGWLQFFFDAVNSSPHSTKQFDDMVSWGQETNPEILNHTTNNRLLAPALSLEEVLERIQCPVLLIHGTDDQICPVDVSREMHRARPDFQYFEMIKSSHAPNAREPVKFNDVLADFLGRHQPGTLSYTRAMARTTKRALFLSSPIGLGHIPRDLEIARALRNLVPDLEIDWLATHPITTVLEQAGERIHPLSAELANKSSHWESMAGEYSLHCFHALREMDEILCHNFMVFLDAVRETPYDLWIGDEAWEVDYYLHENPELKTSPYVFMTDFIGYLPVDNDPGSREAFLTADYNAEMIEHIDRFPYIRDRSIYFGDYDDIVPERFGPDLPFIVEWAQEHFSAVGYPMTFDPERYSNRTALKKRLGYPCDRSLSVTAVGGTAAGSHLLERLTRLWPIVREHSRDAECVLVAGPRISLKSLSAAEGMRVLPYVANLNEHFAAADLGIVQGGLTTAMELVALRRPFISLPLKDHFEQVHHVAYRLNRYRAGRQLHYHEVTDDEIAMAIVAELDADTRGYRPVEPGAIERAAEQIASLI